MNTGAMRVTLAGGLVALVVSATARASVSFSGFGTGSRVNAVSADGSTAVGRIGGRAARWVNGSPQDLNTFGDGSTSTANAVSADGSVIVGNAFNGDIFSPDTLAFRWTSGTGAQSLGATGGSFEAWGALGVSTNGSVVVGRRGFGTGSAFGASFGPPVSSGGSRANGVSSSGAVIVGQSRTDAGDHAEAFRWSSPDGVLLLGALAGGTESSATAVSGDGLAIVGWSDSGAGRRAFRWTIDGMIGLDGEPEGITESTATGVNADGSVIVGNATDMSGSFAFRWTASGGVRPLRGLLEGVGLGLGGWQLTSVTGVSADGLTFVGNAIDPNGMPQGWMATIPTPGLPLLTATVIFCGLARRRARQDR